MKRLFLCLILLVTLSIALPIGCEKPITLDDLKTAMSSISGEVDEVQRVLEQAIIDKQKVDEAIATMEDGPKKDQYVAMSEKLGQVIASSYEWLTKASVTIKELEKETANSKDFVGVAAGAAKVAAPFIPAPWGAILLLVTNGALAIRAAVTRRNARNAIKGVDPYLHPNLTDEQKAAIGLVQGAGGKRLVDEAQGKAWALPI